MESSHHETALWHIAEGVRSGLPEPGRSVLGSLFELMVPVFADVLAGRRPQPGNTVRRARVVGIRCAEGSIPHEPLATALDEFCQSVLTLLSDSADFTAAARVVTELATALVSELLGGAHQTVVHTPNTLSRANRNRRARALLSGENCQHGEGYDIAPAYAVIAAHYRDVEDSTLERAMESVGGPGVLTAVSGRGGFALLPAADGERAYELARKAHRQLPGNAWLAVSWRPAAEIPLGRREAGNVLSLAMGADLDPSVYRIDDVLIEYAVVRESSVSVDLKRIIEPLLEQPALLETLRAVIASDGNRSQAAERLIVHRSTLDYRLQRIEQLTGHNPNSIRGIHLLSAALTVCTVQAQITVPPRPAAASAAG
ncbi:CdaR family transcriptional regulator [Kutzneria buriramensis]|uniref:DNA-binding PucR family transcriptional regulator n=1 Tax=Kutzneria buriramensis TaxID=1045776 RepID=A0A3E0GV88_9PSEU|nr:helix-turn-helix domain-containing protein [Kutzneria buriramensis]REH27019.1 DNA-binding PucR family transcriptional regulator [Kutzneria buriramensis]